MLSRLDAALAYAQKGWAVLPLYGKLPAIAKADGGRGVHDATTNAGTIKTWWTKWPDANLGVACGEASGFWALDVDPRHGGDETLAELEKLHGTLPATVEQFTGGGGRHILFTFNGETIPNGANRIGAGLDTRASGGYIVVEPSCHPETKRPYAWNVDAHPDEVEIADAPAWLIERARKEEPSSAPAPTADPFLTFGRRVTDGGAYGEAALGREAEAVEAAGAGQQEHTLNAAALKIGTLVGAGALDYDNALDTLTEAGLRMANEPDREPWNERQIRAKVEHGLRDGMARPRQIDNVNGSNELTGNSEVTNDRRARRLKPIPWSELGSLPKRETLVKGLLDRGAMSVKFGLYGCGKTFSSLDLACHVALGWPWFGRKTRQGPVVYIAAEGGLGIEERLTAFRYHHGVEPDAPLYVIPVAIDLCKTKRDAAELVREIKPLDPALVVIDTLSRTMAGGNENSPDDMGAFVANCDLIRQATGAHLLVIHHAGKDEGRGTRGHSLLNGAADTLIEVSKDEVSGLFTATVTKQRDRASGDVLAFRLEPIDIGMDEDEDTITSCVVVPSDEPAVPRVKLTGPAKIALDLLGKAIYEAGEKPPASNHIPPDISACPVSLWKRYCETGSVTASDKPDSFDKAFKRAAERLQSLGVIRVWDDWVWITGQDRTRPDKE